MTTCSYEPTLTRTPSTESAGRVRNGRGGLLGLARLLTAALLAAPVIATAAEETPLGAWIVVPSIEVGGTWSNNVGLVQTDEESELAVEVSPAITVDRETDRSALSVAYRGEGLYLTERKDDQLNHQLRSQASFDLVPDTWSVTGSVNHFQVISSPDARFTRNNLNRSNSLVDATTKSLGTDWRQSLGAETEVNAGLRVLRSSQDGLQSVDAWNKQLTAGINGRLTSRVQLGISGQASETDYDGVDQTFSNHRLSSNTAIRLTNTFTVTGQLGLETDAQDPLDRKLDQTVWEVGFIATADDRLRFEVGAGKRSFGSSYRGEVAYSYRRGQVNIRYSETPTGRSEAQGGRLPFSELSLIEGFLDRTGATDFFVSKRLTADASYELRRLTLRLSLSDDKREERSDQFGAPLPNEEAQTVRLAGDYQVGRRTTLSFGGDYTWRKLDFQDTEYANFFFGAVYQLSALSSLDLLYSRNSQRSNRAQGIDFDEDQIRLVFVRQFN